MSFFPKCTKKAKWIDQTHKFSSSIEDNVLYKLKSAGQAIQLMVCSKERDSGMLLSIISEQED